MKPTRQSIVISAVVLILLMLATLAGYYFFTRYVKSRTDNPVDPKNDPKQCTAPQDVSHSDGKPCNEGTAISTTCTTHCKGGYTPSETQLSCVNGELRPRTFKCSPQTPIIIVHNDKGLFLGTGPSPFSVNLPQISATTWNSVWMFFPDKSIGANVGYLWHADDEECLYLDTTQKPLPTLNNTEAWILKSKDGCNQRAGLWILPPLGIPGPIRNYLYKDYFVSYPQSRSGSDEDIVCATTNNTGSQAVAKNVWIVKSLN